MMQNLIFRMGIWIALACSLTFVAAPLLAASIKVVPDTTTVRLGESFNVVFSADANPDGEPDFRPLTQDFDIVSQSQNSQVSIADGHFERRTEWVLTLMARRAGALTLPAISFGRDSSPATPISVEEESAPLAKARDLMLEVEAEPRNPYVQAQVVYTVRILLRVDVAGADLSEPSAADTLVEPLGKERRYTAQRGGQDYTVVERKYALFPQKSGPIQIAPIRLDARVADPKRSRFNSFFNGGTRMERLRSEVVEIVVRTVPSAFVGEHWLPAENLQLEEKWTQDPGRLRVGEPITRTLSLRATGATLGVLPELGALPEQFSDLKQYPEQAGLKEEKDGAGIIAMREEKVVLIPGKPGSIVLPAIEVPWWNIREDRLEIAKVPARKLLVEAAPGSATEPETRIPSPGTGLSAPAPVPAVAVQPTPLTDRWNGTWFWLALFCAVGWVVTAVSWWITRRGDKNPVYHGASVREDERSARHELQMACAVNDAGAARDALLKWARVRYPECRSATLAVWAEHYPEFTDAIDQLERAIFGRTTTPWSGDVLWELYSTVKIIGERQEGGGLSGSLPPLYKKSAA